MFGPKAISSGALPVRCGGRRARACDERGGLARGRERAAVVGGPAGEVGAHRLDHRVGRLRAAGTVEVGDLAAVLGPRQRGEAAANGGDVHRRNAATLPAVADVCITEFTDPGCPWAWSAEPFRRRLTWLYGDRLEWRSRMVVLAERPEEYLEKGFTPERQAEAFAKIAREHEMPIDTSERPRMASTLPACRAIVAARLHAPDRMRALLRRLRVRHFAGDLLDEAETVDAAAAEAGLDAGTLHGWMGGDDVERALREDMAAAREPMPAARVLDDKLANWSGGRRYTCPSYEIVRVSDGVRIAVPGFQPFGVYKQQSHFYLTFTTTLPFARPVST